jgi:hypothetical protein
MLTIHMQDSDVGSIERRGWRPALPFEQGTMPETEGEEAQGRWTYYWWYPLAQIAR